MTKISKLEERRAELYEREAAIREDLEKSKHQIKRNVARKSGRLLLIGGGIILSFVAYKILLPKKKSSKRIVVKPKKKKKSSFQFFRQLFDNRESISIAISTLGTIGRLIRKR